MKRLLAQALLVYLGEFGTNIAWAGYNEYFAALLFLFERSWNEVSTIQQLGVYIDPLFAQLVKFIKERPSIESRRTSSIDKVRSTHELLVDRDMILLIQVLFGALRMCVELLQKKSALADSDYELVGYLGESLFAVPRGDIETELLAEVPRIQHWETRGAAYKLMSQLGIRSTRNFTEVFKMIE